MQLDEMFVGMKGHKKLKENRERLDKLKARTRMSEADIDRAVDEGYRVLPPIDDRYQERDGLEGPFRADSGKVLYYDPREGKYYDPDTDMYLSHEEYEMHQGMISGMQEASPTGKAGSVYDNILMGIMKYAKQHGRMTRNGTKVGMRLGHDNFNRIADQLGIKWNGEGALTKALRSLQAELQNITLTRQNIKKHADAIYAALPQNESVTEADDGLHIGDPVHLGFGAAGGAGFFGTIVDMDEHTVIIKHENGKTYKGPIEFVTKEERMDEFDMQDSLKKARLDSKKARHPTGKFRDYEADLGDKSPAMLRKSIKKDEVGEDEMFEAGNPGEPRHFTALVKAYNDAAFREHKWHMTDRQGKQYSAALQKLKAIEKEIYQHYGKLSDAQGNRLQDVGIDAYDTSSPAAFVNSFMGSSMQEGMADMDMTVTSVGKKGDGFVTDGRMVIMSPMGKKRSYDPVKHAADIKKVKARWPELEKQGWTMVQDIKESYKEGDRVKYSDHKDSISARRSKNHGKTGTVSRVQAGNLAKVKFDGGKRNSTVNMDQLDITDEGWGAAGQQRQMDAMRAEKEKHAKEFENDPEKAAIYKAWTTYGTRGSVAAEKARAGQRHKLQTEDAVEEAKMSPADMKLARTVKRAYDRDEPGMSPAYGAQLKAAHRRLTMKYGKGWMKSLTDEAIVPTDKSKYPEHEYMDDETGQLYKDQADVDSWNKEQEPKRHKTLNYDAFTKGAKIKEPGAKDKWAVVGDFGDVAAGGGDPIDYVINKHGVSIEDLDAIALDQGYDNAHDWAMSYQEMESVQQPTQKQLESAEHFGLAFDGVTFVNTATNEDTTENKYAFHAVNEDTGEHAMIFADGGIVRGDSIEEFISRGWVAQQISEDLSVSAIESKINLKNLARMIDEGRKPTEIKGLVEAAQSIGVHPMEVVNAACKKYLGASTYSDYRAQEMFNEQYALVANMINEAKASFDIDDPHDANANHGGTIDFTPDSNWTGVKGVSHDVPHRAHKTRGDLSNAKEIKAIQDAWRQLVALHRRNGNSPAIKQKMDKLRMLASKKGVELSDDPHKSAASTFALGF